LDADFDFAAPGVTLDRYCGSGITAVGLAAMGIMSGLQDLVFACGIESMSHNSTLNREFMLDSGNLELRKKVPQPHQGLCADMIATMEGFTREELDRFAYESQQRAAQAMREGRFDRSIIPVLRSDGTVALDKDEYPRPQTTLEALTSLKPAFETFFDRVIDDQGNTYGSLIRQVYPDLKINYLHTAGTSSGIVDGAGGLILASPEYANAHGLKPRARIRALVTAGDDPTLMLNGPVPATRKALKQAGMEMRDIDLVEINEAFAVVPLKFMRDLDVPHEKVNVNGGSIALGHPIGATGAILVNTLLDEMERRDLTTGLATMCTAGGMAPAIIIERI
ncbi:MAG TPA: acetyl-CoA C-acyltransferase, partial [Sphingomonadales bacterium]